MNKVTKDMALFNDMLSDLKDLMGVYLNSHFDDFTESIDLELDFACEIIAMTARHMKDKEEFLQDILGDIREKVSRWDK